MSLYVPFMSAFLNYRAQKTSYIVILCTTKILLLPRFLKCTFPCLLWQRHVSEVNTLAEFAPERPVCSVGEGIEGGENTCCPCNVILARPHRLHDCRCLVYMISSFAVQLNIFIKYEFYGRDYFTSYTNFI